MPIDFCVCMLHMDIICSEPYFLANLGNIPTVAFILDQIMGTQDLTVLQ